MNNNLPRSPDASIQPKHLEPPKPLNLKPTAGIRRIISDTKKALEKFALLGLIAIVPAYFAADFTQDLWRDVTGYTPAPDIAKTGVTQRASVDLDNTKRQVNKKKFGEFGSRKNVPKDPNATEPDAWRKSFDVIAEAYEQAEELKEKAEEIIRSAPGEIAQQTGEALKDLSKSLEKMSEDYKNMIELYESSVDLLEETEKQMKNAKNIADLLAFWVSAALAWTTSLYILYKLSGLFLKRQSDPVLAHNQLVIAKGVDDANLTQHHLAVELELEKAKTFEAQLRAYHAECRAANLESWLKDPNFFIWMQQNANQFIENQKAAASDLQMPNIPGQQRIAQETTDPEALAAAEEEANQVPLRRHKS